MALNVSNTNKTPFAGALKHRRYGVMNTSPYRRTCPLYCFQNCKILKPVENISLVPKQMCVCKKCPYCRKISCNDGYAEPRFFRRSREFRAEYLFFCRTFEPNTRLFFAEFVSEINHGYSFSNQRKNLENSVTFSRSTLSIT